MTHRERRQRKGLHLRRWERLLVPPIDRALLSCLGNTQHTRRETGGVATTKDQYNTIDSRCSTRA